MLIFQHLLSTFNLNFLILVKHYLSALIFLTGKSTVLYQMQFGQKLNTIPNIGFNVEKTKICKGLQMAVFDVGGQDKLRQLWKHHYQDATGIYIFF